MPRKTRRNPARRIPPSSSSSSARLTLASVMNENGRPWRSDQSASAGRNCLTLRLLPMKLPATMTTVPRQPARPQRVHLGEHLRGALGARDAAIDLRHVAELALEGAAAGVLYGHRIVAAQVGEAEV